jgi:hypothetical protein
MYYWDEKRENILDRLPRYPFSLFSPIISTAAKNSQPPLGGGGGGGGVGVVVGHGGRSKATCLVHGAIWTRRTRFVLDSVNRFEQRFYGNRSSGAGGLAIDTELCSCLRAAPPSGIAIIELLYFVTIIQKFFTLTSN